MSVDIPVFSPEVQAVIDADEAERMRELRRMRGQNDQSPVSSSFESMFGEKKEEEEIECLPLSVFQESILNIHKILPPTENGLAVYRFKVHIRGKTVNFQIPLNSLKSPGFFNDMLWTHFGVHMPYEISARPKKGEPNKWQKLLMYFEQTCEEVEPVESQEWIETEMLLDQLVAGFTIVEDAGKWAEKNNIKSNRSILVEFVGDTQYCLIKSKGITEMVKDLHLQTPIEKIGNVLTVRGFKRAGNPVKRVGKVIVGRVWWIRLDVLKERGLNVALLQDDYTPLQEEGGY